MQPLLKPPLPPRALLMPPPPCVANGLIMTGGTLRSPNKYFARRQQKMDFFTAKNKIMTKKKFVIEKKIILRKKLNFFYGEN